MQVVAVLKKELMKTQNKELERSGEYRQMLVQSIHQCAVKFPNVAGAVVHLMMEFLSDNSTIGMNNPRQCIVHRLTCRLNPNLSQFLA